ncbi:putative map kinase kinase [Phaeomoniella chlamydospora]|uniref:mitogen-activated protein kinase kinase n=1 Tax=Phaeomoniella chlamydospora TaxID=158046 RepID=A0A0G2E4X4_PHACM|nr:putative map kinase kinase [Phaeomoniella chlamydospora]
MDGPATSSLPPESPGTESDMSDSSHEAKPSSTASTPELAVPPPVQPPTLKTLPSDAPTPIMSSSSTPLGQINAARRPGPLPAKASGLSQDLQARMKAFSLSRQGAPPSAASLRLPGGVPAKPMSTGDVHEAQQTSSGSFVGNSGTSTPASPAGSLPGGLAGLRLPPGISRPGVPNWNSSPSAPGVRGPPKPPMGGLAAKRGLKPGGMKLSDVTGPPPAPSENSAEPKETPTDSAFDKYSQYVDTKSGSLNFKGKAVIHGHGIEFSSGTSFSISLDEVDTMDELGKGNYGTVYKVRHSRPRIRRPGLGLRGNLPRPSSSSITGSSSDTTAEDSPSKGDTSGIVMAMKEIRLELDEAKFAAIIMELDVLHRCVSPFIIDFYGAFFQEGAVYICMEWMDGGSVDKLYGDGIPEGVLKKITLSTVMGLKSLKDDHNIIHRDVKPTNILCNTRGQVKICDFGVSGNLVASIAKTNIGCQSYMAPERISGGGVAQAGANPGGGTYSVQSDIWSLGLSIIECAMGRYPYPPETYNNIFSQLSAIVDGEPPDLPAEGYTEAARDFVRGCLNKIPKLRPTYAMLLRHAWLAPLMKPPTISEEDEEEEASEITNGEPVPETADKEVGGWVTAALERRAAGRMGKSDKPALHAAPLDAVPGSPLMEQKPSSSAQAPGVEVA